MRAAGLLLAIAISAAQRVVGSTGGTANIFEDVLAHPHYEIAFSDIPLTHDEADTLLKSESSTYESMKFSSRSFVCNIPPPPTTTKNSTERSLTRSAEAAESSRAADKGIELITSAMQGKCLYYVADWWSYSFCYPLELRQFHAMQPPPGKPAYPPKEDPEGATYVLGRGAKSATGKKKKRDVAVHTNGETKYLVETWTGGTICDLTGRPRSVEIQWYCAKEGKGEIIGSIREVAICVYAITIFTDKLCKEKAFLPAERSGGEKILCKEVIPEDQKSDWMKAMEHQKVLALDAAEAAKETARQQREKDRAIAEGLKVLLEGKGTEDEPVVAHFVIKDEL